MDMTFESLRDLIISDRSYRRFDNSAKISRETLVKLVDLTRLCSSGRNAQPLRYRIVCDEKEQQEIFPLLKWAGYYTDWDGPQPHERPSAYLVQCLDTHFGNDCLCDDGLQLQAITMAASALGYGCCIIKAFDLQGMAEKLGLDSRYRPRYVVAIGKPAEKVVIEEMSGSDDADFKYFRTPDGIHHVPKRPLSEIII